MAFDYNKCMIDTILDFISKNFGVAVVILVLLILAFVYLIWWTSSMWFKIKSLPCDTHTKKIDKHTEIVNSVSHLPCSRIEHAVESYEERIRATENTLSRIEGLIQGLYKYAPKMYDNDFSCDIEMMSQKHSPRALNDNGLSLFNEINGQQFLNENKNLFFEAIDNFAPKTALDVEAFCIAVLRIKSNEDCFNPIKVWVYNSPSRDIIGEDGTIKKRDISFDTVLFVLSIPLRDMYLNEHPEILQS